MDWSDWISVYISPPFGGGLGFKLMFVSAFFFWLISMPKEYRDDDFSQLWWMLLPLRILVPHTTYKLSESQIRAYSKARWFSYALLSISLVLFVGTLLIYEIKLTPDQKLARAEKILELEEKARERSHEQALSRARARVQAEHDKKARIEREAIEEMERLAEEAQAKIRAEKEAQARAIKEAQVKVKLALIEKRRSELRGENTPSHITAQIEDLNRELESLVSSKSIEPAHVREIKAKLRAEKERASRKLERLRNSPESLSELEAARAELRALKANGPREQSAPIDDQTKLILSGLWLGACFFLQRVLEKLFKDKGYALLTVCAAGFLLAFFTANYFLLGGSVTGGLMGSVGDRG